VSLLRQHIQKEDHCLFPMADSALDARLQEELEGLFADADGAAAETREKCLALVDTIAERLGLNGGRGAAHSAATAGATVARSPHA
jgi:hemerythrin-like domain-containing protein